ncbi:syncytin-2-like [Huso huso]|uniref:Syncytin-2-like n=1 Tax=Huso huso TaxID=61971 RepID=A0ABR0Y9U2_HUSHU
MDVYWLCGVNVWAMLPPGWQGCCTLVRLNMSLIIIPTTQHAKTRRKRALGDPNNVPLEHRRSTAWDKFWRGVLPAYGAMEAAHDLDRIGYHLESFCNATLLGFSTLTAEVKEIRLMVLQNRAALDYLLAAEGGVCAVVGEHCCTYIPDISENMTDVANQLNRLRSAIMEEEHGKEGWEPFAWVKTLLGTWGSTLFHWVIYGLVVLLVLVLVLACVKKLCTKMVNSALTMPLLTTGKDSDKEEEEEGIPLGEIESDVMK